MKLGHTHTILWLALLSLPIQEAHSKVVPVRTCAAEYQLASKILKRALTDQERQAVSNCEVAALRYYTVQAYYFPKYGRGRSLPTPAMRSWTQIERAFSDLATHRTTVEITQDTATQVLLDHEAQGVLALMTATRGSWSPEIETWITLNDALSESARYGGYEPYRSTLRCMKKGAGLKPKPRIQALVDSGCAISVVFEFSTAAERTAVFELAQSGRIKGARDFAIAARVALSDDRYLAISVPADETGLIRPPFKKGLSDIRYTLVASLGRTADRFAHPNALRIPCSRW